MSTLLLPCPCCPNLCLYFVHAFFLATCSPPGRLTSRHGAGGAPHVLSQGRPRGCRRRQAPHCIAVVPGRHGLQLRVEADPEDWALRRSLGEALLEDGQRDEGIKELDAAMVGFEKSEDLAGARSVADEIVRVNPNSVRHHQKRVEYCFRSNDRAGLVEAYLELADALFRDGQTDKSRTVYQRIIELQPGNARAESALATFGAPAVTPVAEPPLRGRSTTSIRSTTALKRYTGSEAGAGVG